METTRPRLNSTRLQRRHTNDSRDNAFMIKTLRQLVVCVIIGILVFAISKFDEPACKNITSSIKNTLLYTIDYKATTIGIIESMKNIPKLFSNDNQEMKPEPSDNITNDNQENQPNDQNNIEDNNDVQAN